MMRRMGYQVELAPDGNAVLDRLERDDFDVVLMDMHMPNMDGIEATKQIVRRWPVEVRPRVIAVTAAILAEDRRRCVEAGMVDFVGKPFNVNDLKRAPKPHIAIWIRVLW